MNHFVGTLYQHQTPPAMMPRDNGGKPTDHELIRHQMISEIKIRNFKCFERLDLAGCRRVNVLVGDNGSGKTALLEALFWALSSNPQMVLRYRQQRGLDGSFTGSPQQIEQAIWREYFFEHDWKRTIAIELVGSGPESRSVKIIRGHPQPSIPLVRGPDEGDVKSIQITMIWRDFQGNEHFGSFRFKDGQVKFEGGEEDLPDFFYYPANQTISSIENAGRFSELSRARRAAEFAQVFRSEYEWIEDISIEVVAGAPAIYAALRGQTEKLPLPSVSGGVNRIISVLLALASRVRSVVLVDEIENGIYYRHHKSMWSSLLKFTRTYEGQLFVTTHNDEWLQSLVDAADSEVDDIALWRVERDKNNRPIVRQFNGEQVVAGIQAGGVR
jgi:ABC-type transport system involved in cytochrome c biogenesis ATPase subunit